MSRDNIDLLYINLADLKSASKYRQYRGNVISRREYQEIVRAAITSLNNMTAFGYIRLNEREIKRSGGAVIVPVSLKGLISKYCKTRDIYRDQLD